MYSRLPAQPHSVHDIEHPVLADHERFGNRDWEEVATQPHVARLPVNIQLPDLVEQVDRLVRQRHEMLRAHLHSLRGNPPKRVGCAHVFELGELGEPSLRCAHHRHDRPAKREVAHPFAGVGVELHIEVRKILGRNLGAMADGFLFRHGGAEVAAGIAVAAAIGDCVAEDLAAIILDPMRRLERSARLDRAEDIEHLARSDRRDVLVADDGEHVVLKPAHDARAIFWNPGEHPRLEPFARYLLESAAHWHRRNRQFLPALLRWIETEGELMLHLVTPGPGVGECGLGIAPAREQFGFAVMAIGEAPELRAIGLDKNEEATAVGLLVSLGVRLQRLQRNIGEHEFAFHTLVKPARISYPKKLG